MKLPKNLELYNLPWKKENNPNGWLEITTFCQLDCPGCYRGLDKKDPKRINFDLGELKKQVDYMKDKRNVQTISISGGEPLLYPHLDNLISYINSKNLRIKIYTNGLNLTERNLSHYRDLGVTEFVIHIDKTQNRIGFSSEKELNKLREDFCKIFRSVGGINLGFIMPISRINISEMEEILHFYKKNADVINLIVFTRYNDGLTSGKTHLKEVSLEEMAEKVKKIYFCNPSSYLSKVLDKDSISWLFFYPIIHKKKTIGSISPEKYLKLQERYKLNRGKYFITIKGNKLKTKSLFFFFNFFKAIKLLFSKEKVYNQTILLIDSPTKINGKWNLCDGCPDPVLYNNKLVPSCLLERVKGGEDISLK